jgi:hypothetical protein
MGPRLAILIFCLLVAGCAGSPTRVEEAKGLPPFPDALREASLATYTKLGSEASSSSPEALPLGTDMVIPSTAGGMNWAVYELTPGERPLQLQVTLRDPQTTEAWVGLADFAARSWELRGPVPSSELFELDRARHVTPTGSVFAAVIVTGLNYAVVEKLEITEREPPIASLTATETRGAPGTEITLDASLSLSPDGAIVDYKWDLDGDGSFETDTGIVATTPAFLPDPVGIAFYRVQVTDDAGVQAEAELRVSSYAEFLDVGVTLDGGFGGVRVVNGMPAVVYSISEAGREGLYYQRALDADGLEWGDAVLVQAGPIPWAPGLELIAGNPAIAFTLPDGAYYTRALDTNGDTWATPMLAAPGTKFVMARKSFEDIGGLPAFLISDSVPLQPFFVIADDVAGTTWQAPVEVGPTGRGGYGGFVLTAVDGLPTCFYDKYMIQAEDALGHNWSPGNVKTIHDGWYPRVAQVGGQPCVLYARDEEVQGQGLEVDFLSGYASGYFYQPPQTILDTENYFEYTDLALSHDRAWAIGTGYNELLYTSAPAESLTVWAPPTRIALTVWDAELVELAAGTAVVYTDDPNGGIWFDWLEVSP